MRVVDKMPANFLYAGLIHAVFPRARIIHMRRHPIDTCLSIYSKTSSTRRPTATIWSTSLIITASTSASRITGEPYCPRRRSSRFPSEDLVADQERWSRRMLEFIGLPWDPTCLEFHRSERVVITASKWQVRQRIHGASVGRWRNYERYLGPLESLLCERVHAAGIDGAGANAQASADTRDAAQPLKGSR